MPTIKPGSKDTTKLIGAQDGSGIAEDKAMKESVVEVKETPERRSTNVGAQRMGNLRNKFETGEVSEKKKKKKAAPKIKYAGAESVKNKFIETASKTSNGTANGPRGPKEITPPPEGVAVGVLESKPKPRNPDVVTADDTLDPVDLSIIGETTKNLRAKFKHLEETGGQLEEEDKPKQNALIDEYKSVAPEATRSARARWKDIESGKVEKSTEERPKIDIHGEGYGGVFENEPEKLENITRSGEDSRSLPAGISARERREEFLRRASEAASLKKEPVRVDINAAEGGIYENEPTRREDVVRYDDEQNDDYPSASAKWASEAKDRFMQEASKAQEQVQRTKPIAVVETEANGEGTAEYRFASQAKQALIERQRQEEEAAKNKARPGIIDIWGEQCAESGVFENVPAARSADVVAGGMTDEEESEEESEEE
ncbi:hypothetical protein CRM22_008214 [Opisthorchis felineus]|uniref:Uncharacterized protein n=1 Tax=Opisthorchis felineus TaxID=147828 RepID=A0A4S2LC59_OPIFE|nr:hypothetical protein CRM22_008214 [Opisthorchis felineus]TGZ61010.1 hypothetical protein CRM22_008214 [Opisthorchis felineus]TGZ61011.1 hypothetical protein CRM22_008214 [Opisthorchis felineus]TGZ61012.1 hypothetical protein CRM22_008214 [Opisthorchis felineus]